MANQLFIFNALKPILDYENEQQCYEDRRNHRELWYELIRAYNSKDRARLARQLFKTADVYVGIRDEEELAAARAAGLFDALIWVDANERLPVESTSSCRVGPEDADFILDNNGPAEALHTNIANMMAWFQRVRPSS